MMTTPMTRASAKIYQFPVRAQMAAAERRLAAASAYAPTSPQAPPIVYGSSWYHDDAIADAKLPGKR